MTPIRPWHTLPRLWRNSPTTLALAPLSRLPTSMCARDSGTWRGKPFCLMVDHYPAHPLAVDAYRWLVCHVSSSEARRRQELGQFSMASAVQLNPRLNPDAKAADVQQVKGTEVARQGRVDFLADKEQTRQWFQGSLLFGQRLAAFGPLYASDPAIQFCLQASRRQLANSARPKNGTRSSARSAPRDRGAMPPRPSFGSPAAPWRRRGVSPYAGAPTPSPISTANWMTPVGMAWSHSSCKTRWAKRPRNTQRRPGLRTTKSIFISRCVAVTPPAARCRRSKTARAMPISIPIDRVSILLDLDPGLRHVFSLASGSAGLRARRLLGRFDLGSEVVRRCPQRHRRLASRGGDPAQ